MRISTQQVFGRGIESIQDVTKQAQKSQLQLSTGKKILTPADDPVASTRILELKQELALNSQFQRNIELVDGRLKLQDDLLGSINDVVQRIRELAVTAGNGVLNQDDLGYIAAEVEERLEQLAGLLNSQDSSGEFMFSGFQGGTQPFQRNASGAFEYQGDEGRRFVQIEPSVTIASTENGKAIFQDVAAADNTFYTKANPNNQAVPPAQITVGQVVDQDVYDAFYPEDMTITFTSATTFNVTESSTGRPVLSNAVYAPNQPILVNGVQVEISGSPLTGDSFFIESTPKQGLLTTVEKFIYGLENFRATSPGREAFDQLISSTLSNLDNAETSILEARSQIGARLNTIETTEEQLKDVEILTQEILNNLEAVDYAETVSLLSLQQFTLEAAYSSYSKITSLTLFDRL
ncbi:MAG: flagellar hook-associated protein FlgL [Oleiphilaceae bacterium]|nr:flagellar hook-associated protein FlgL [Oleiphilaceae bacterium]